MKCPLCNGTETIVKDKHLGLFQCRPCNHTFTVAEKQTEDYGEDYFITEHENWFNNPNYKLFSSIYNRIIGSFGAKSLRLLDVGCGKGDLLQYIAKKNPDMELWGIDLTPNQYGKIHFIKGDFLATDINMEFDVICSLATIEHVNNPNEFMQKIHRLLKPGGLLFIMTINNNSLIYRIARLLRKIGVHAPYERVYAPHHVQHFTNRSLRKLMVLYKFRVISQKKPQLSPASCRCSKNRCYYTADVCGSSRFAIHHI